MVNRKMPYKGKVSELNEGEKSISESATRVYQQTLPKAHTVHHFSGPRFRTAVPRFLSVCLIENLSRNMTPALASLYLPTIWFNYMGHGSPGILLPVASTPRTTFVNKTPSNSKVREQRPEDGVAGHITFSLFISNNVINYHNPHLPILFGSLYALRSIPSCGPNLNGC